MLEFTLSEEKKKKESCKWREMANLKLQRQLKGYDYAQGRTKKLLCSSRPTLNYVKFRHKDWNSTLSLKMNATSRIKLEE